MKSKGINLTCKAREDVLELQNKLKHAINVYNIKLYEPDKVNVTIGRALISLSSDHSKQTIEAVYTKAIKIYN